VTEQHHKRPVTTRGNHCCEMCGTPISGGHYELSIVRESGNNVLWLMDKIACVQEFTRRYMNLDYALEDGEDENEGDDE
jgi:hypothetical protein